MEKAQFPDYFTKRFELKKKYIEWYTKKYGITKYNPDEEGHIHELDGDHHHDSHHHGEHTEEHGKKHH
jgi:hypothetical protein